MTKNQILEKYNIKEHQWKHIKKKYGIKEISVERNKHIYDPLDVEDAVLKYTPKKPWSDEEVNTLKGCYPLGGYKECQKLINRKEKDIKYKAYSLDIYLDDEVKTGIYRKSMLARESVKSPEDYKINYERLSNVKDKYVCYFLGFLWADGCVRDNRIFMTLIKEDMLNGLEKILPEYGKWNFRDTMDKYRTFNVYCVPYYNWLSSMGYVNKSYEPPIKLLKIIPKENKSYFFRGLIDGDGSFPLSKSRDKTSFSITGTYGYDWGFFTDVLDSINVKYSIRNVIKDSGYRFSEVRVYRQKDIITIGEYLYGDWDGIGLERKMVKSFWNLPK